MKFTKKDLWYSIVTGLITGIIAWQLLEYLGTDLSNFGLKNIWLVVIIPFLWIIGVGFGYFLGRWMPFFNQFGKFAAIGFTNAAVDFGILFLLIAYSGKNAGIAYTVFKAISFVAATMHSYFWNKFWAFDEGSAVQVKQVGKFFSVSILAMLINVFFASIVTNNVSPLFGFTQDQWAAIGAVIGSATALVFSFVGFKLAVFKK